MSETADPSRIRVMGARRSPEKAVRAVGRPVPLRRQARMDAHSASHAAALRWHRTARRSARACGWTRRPAVGSRPAARRFSARAALSASSVEAIYGVVVAYSGMHTNKCHHDAREGIMMHACMFVPSMQCYARIYVCGRWDFFLENIMDPAHAVVSHHGTPPHTPRPRAAPPPLRLSAPLSQAGLARAEIRDAGTEESKAAREAGGGGGVGLDGIAASI